MNLEKRKEYGAVRLLDIECETPYNWQEGDATHVRVCLPSGLTAMEEMRRRGFSFADRLLDVSIGLSRTKLDFASLVRLEPRLTSERREDVLKIAKASFPQDRRFHVGLGYDEALSSAVLKGWVEELEEYYLCEHKGEAIGFLALTAKGDGQRAFVHLAAVLERYRASGAALSLYAAAARDCKNWGLRYLDGRISTCNTAVMNLYAFLGATFSKTWDVYLKEV